jgi:hypothetical protein
MLSQIWGDLTFANFLTNLVWTAIFAGLTRMFMSALRIPVRKELAYWVSVSMLIFAVILFVGSSETNRPRLTVAPTEITTIDTPDQKAALVVMTAAVTNTGAPTSVGAYQLQAVFPAGHTVVAQRQTIPDKGILIEHRNGLVQWVCGADALDRKTLTPVPTGGAVYGQLFYVFPSTTKASLESSGVKLTLRAMDVWNKITSWEYEVKAGSVGPVERVMDWPGLTLQPRTLQAPPPQPTAPGGAAPPQPPVSPCAPVTK